MLKIIALLITAGYSIASAEPLAWNSRESNTDVTASFTIANSGTAILSHQTKLFLFQHDGGCNATYSYGFFSTSYSSPGYIFSPGASPKFSAASAYQIILNGLSGFVAGVESVQSIQVEPLDILGHNVFKTLECFAVTCSSSNSECVYSDSPRPVTLSNG